MQYYIDELYAGCTQELNVLCSLLEQDKQSLPSCVGGEVLESYQKNTELLLRQLDSIKADLVKIFAD